MHRILKRLHREILDLYIRYVQQLQIRKALWAPLETMEALSLSRSNQRLLMMSIPLMLIFSKDQIAKLTNQLVKDLGKRVWPYQMQLMEKDHLFLPMIFLWQEKSIIKSALYYGRPQTRLMIRFLFIKDNVHKNYSNRRQRILYSYTCAEY